MPKTSMEEVQVKLKALIEKAQKQKIDLSKIKSIRKREKFFAVSNKCKFCVVVLIFAIFYGHFGEYFFTKSVRFTTVLSFIS